jgi:serine/threonine protein kinase
LIKPSAYILEILPAFSYLHDLGLIYCDFKPDNLIQVGDAVKLIDLGGVRRVDDQESAIYGTVGYQGARGAQVGPAWHPTSTRSGAPRGADDGVPGLPEQVRRKSAARR